MIRAFLVDDEELALIFLEKKLQEFPDINIIKTYTDHTKVLHDIETAEIDVVFLDINMGSISGLDLADIILTINSKIDIVFVSAYMEYAVQAFEINSIDYVLKPVTVKRLQKTINRLVEKREISKTVEKNKIQDTSKDNLAIKCFYDFQVYHNNQPVQFKTVKVKELFAFLLTHMNEYINRDIIIDKLWPDQDYKKAKINLHTSLSHLRKKLNELGYPNCITFSDTCYSISTVPIDCDALIFDTALQALGNINDANIQAAEETIQLYTGSYMELNGYEWAQEKSIEYQEKLMNLLQKVIEYYKNRNISKAIYYLQRLLKENPYSDENIKHVMELLIQQGDRCEAIIIYQDYKQLLLQDIGIEPSETLVVLYNSIK